MAKFITYLVLRLLIVITAILPFRLLYLLSDFFYLIVFYLIGYRKNVVRQNLKESFPAMSDLEISWLTKKYYHHFCDIALESIKGFTMSRQDILKRHKIRNPEIVDEYYKNKTSVIAVPAHYNNWEWGSMSPGLHLQFDIVAFYKPLSNKWVDKYAKLSRSKFRTQLASIKETSLTFQNKVNAPSAFIMAADQSPSNLKDSIWVNFLNHETACLHGPEKYSRRYNLPVIYVDIQKVKRGYYELTLVKICDNPNELEQGVITTKYMKLLEQSILKEPAFWIWSHKRWKHRRN